MSANVWNEIFLSLSRGIYLGNTVPFFYHFPTLKWHTKSNYFLWKPGQRLFHSHKTMAAGDLTTQKARASAVRILMCLFKKLLVLAPYTWWVFVHRSRYYTGGDNHVFGYVWSWLVTERCKQYWGDNQAIAGNSRESYTIPKSLTQNIYEHFLWAK